MSEKELVIIDTDGGCDDAEAILLALTCKDKAEVLAITCCFGNTPLNNVCSNVKRILTLCNEKEIPIHRGCPEAIIVVENDEIAFGTDGLGNVAKEFSTGDLEESPPPAPLALIQYAEKYPNKITLVAIGPCTNIALAQKIDPQFTKNLKSLMVMGGNYKGIGNVTEVAEFNFYCDPESANIVMTETSCPKVLVPWETVYEYGIDWDVYEELTKVDTAKGKFMKRVNEFYVENAHKKDQKRLWDADFVAVAALLYPECIEGFIEHSVSVECAGTLTRGQTILLKKTDEENKIKILTDFDEKMLNKLRFKLREECPE